MLARPFDGAMTPAVGSWPVILLYHLESRRAIGNIDNYIIKKLMRQFFTIISPFSEYRIGFLLKYKMTSY